MFHSGDAGICRIADDRAKLCHRDIGPDRVNDAFATTGQAGAQEGDAVVGFSRMQDETHWRIGMHTSAFQNGAAAKGRLKSEHYIFHFTLRCTIT